MAKSKIAVGTLFLVLVMGIGVRSATLRVPTPEYPTVQSGINSAASGDTVLVAAGAHTGPGNNCLQVFGKQLYVVGESGAEATIIDGLGAAFAGFGCNWGEIDARTVVDGFTVTGCEYGLFAALGGGVFRNCRFVDNAVAGVGVDCLQNPLCSLYACTIGGNPSGFARNCGRRTVGAATAEEEYDHRFVFDSCTFDDNERAVATFAELRNCTLTRNRLVFDLDVLPTVHVFESEISGNLGPIAVLTADAGDDIDQGSLFLYNCSIFENAGGINRGSDPSLPFGRLHMTGCLYHSNQGPIEIDGHPCAAVIERNTFVDNPNFALRFTRPRRDSTVHRVANNIVAFNQGCGITCEDSGSVMDLECNDFFSNSDGNYCGALGDSTGFNENISVDPLFEDRGTRDYRLRSDSPCHMSPLGPCEELKGWPDGNSSTQVPNVDTLPPQSIGDLQ